MDRQLYRPEGGGSSSGISAYARLSGSPTDRDLIDLRADAGVGGVVPERPDDLFGARFLNARIGNARIGAAARAFDRDRLAFGDGGFARTAEASLELSYPIRVVPGWTVQPDVQ